MSAGMRLYDLAGADERVRFSPYCWRTRFALAHKALSTETVAWRFTEKDAIAFSGQGKVPVLVDGEHCIHDSWQIAEYLEATYPDRPSLFGSASEHALVRFVERWTTETLHPAIARVIAPDLLAILHEKDRAYFQTTREAAFGTTFAAMTLARDEALATLRQVLQPLRSTLAAQPFLAGAAPNYADQVAFGAFQWARVSSPLSLLAADDTPLHAWCERMLDAYGGIARAAQRAV
jgi:glutathione S-transferase